MGELHRQDQAAGQGVYAVPTGAHVKDNEQVKLAFLMLLPCPRKSCTRADFMYS